MSSPARDVHGTTEAPSGFVRRYIFQLGPQGGRTAIFLPRTHGGDDGIVLSLLMRFHLVWPAAHLPFVAGGIMEPEQYLALVTMHGTLMVFFVLTVAPQSAFGNYFLPIQIGAPDMAFPKLNMLSFWLTFTSFVCMIAAFLFAAARPSAVGQLIRHSVVWEKSQALGRAWAKHCGSSAF